MDAKRCTIFNRKNWLAVILISLVPPAIFLSSELILGNGFKGDLPIDLITSTLFSFCATGCLYFGVSYLLHRLHDTLPWQQFPVRRLAVETLIVLGYALVIMTLLSLLFHRLVIPEVSWKPLLYSNLLVALTLTIIVTAIQEGRYFLEQWKNSVVQSEKLKKEMAESRYEALKNQVNPHFLFNSLNSLSALVRRDPKKAEEFIQAFSSVYRYVLEMSGSVVVELSREIAFLQSYFFLQKIRFGDNLVTEVEVPAEKMHDLVPPLSLQLLAENAVKHNQISAERPLHISVTTENGFLVMKNNLQLRNELVDSTGIGLKNLRSRYEAISEIAPVFAAIDSYYIAKLPLIQSE